jgi:hypothetical protein
VTRRRQLLASAAVGLALAATLGPVRAGATPHGESYGFDSEAVTVTRADTWHRAGVRGQGVTIAMVGRFETASWNAAANRGELPPTSEVLCRLDFGGNCPELAGGPDTKLAEVVHDVAPDATLAVTSASTADELEDELEWLVSAGVDILVHPATAPIDGPGDGTGPLDDVFDDLVAEGITVVQPVGDSAARPGGRSSYYRWAYADEDHDGFLEFAPGDETLSAPCASSPGLRWDDFGEGVDATNYDVWVDDGTFDFKRGNARQDLGAPPVEPYAVCFATGARTAEIRVELIDEGAAAVGDTLELLGTGGGFEYSTDDGSASVSGADSANAGVLTVGATDTALGTRISPTSSRGPTTDGRTVPDLVAPSCLTTWLGTIRYGDVRCYDGTVAAAAVVAGAAALRLQEAPSSTPADLATWLTTSAVQDAGAAGPDAVYGAGVLRLPAHGLRNRYRPDARLQGRGSVVGNDRYGADGVGQQVTASERADRNASFTLTVQNDGTAAERMTVEGPHVVNGYRLMYLVGTTDVTSQVTGTGYLTPLVQPGALATIKVRARVPHVPRGRQARGLITVYSYSNLRTTDAVRFVAREA